MKKKIISTLLLVILIVACLTCFIGCDNKKDDDTIKYTVTFMNGGDVYQTQTVVEESYAKLPTKPKKDGFDFVGWYLNVGDKESFSFDGQKITEDITLYAVWKESETMAEKMKLGGLAALIGIVAVFVILGILIGFIYLTRVVLDIKGKKKGGKATKEVVSKPVNALGDSNGVSPEIVAVITASVAMMLEESNDGNAPQTEFVVRSIKHIR